MAKLEGFRALKKEDFKPEQQTLIGTLGSIFNPFMSLLVNALNNNLTVTDNLNQEFRSLTLQVDASGVPTRTIAFPLVKLGNIKINGIEVIRVQNLTNSTTYPSGAPFISFTQTGSIVTINHITGLQTGNEFIITLKIIGN